jgi:hypothetical protein
VTTLLAHRRKTIAFDRGMRATALKVVEEYKASVRRYPNPPAANITRF